MSHRQRFSLVLRWIARLASAFLLLLFVVFGVGEGLSDIAGLSKRTPTEYGLFVSLLVSLAGLVVAFFRPLWGTLLILAGYLAFSVLEGNMNLDSPFLVFPVIVVLYGLSAALHRNGSHPIQAHT